jgi:peptidoglycan/LPS O-acetylase OafA/YrhL
LDGVRGCAILLVLLFHLNLLDTTSSVNSSDQIFSKLAGAGWCGVDLFFVLSGFLITGILYDSKNGSNYFRNFYLRRILRIFPLYYAVLFISFAVIPNLPIGVVPAGNLERLNRVQGDEIWYWLYLSNFYIALVGEWRHGILDVTWSLAIEEQFYIFWPFVVYLLNRKQLMLTCAFLFIITLGIRSFMVFSATHPITILVLTITRIDTIAVGAFAALVIRGNLELQRISNFSKIVWGISAVFLLGIFYFRGGFKNTDPIVQTIGFSVLCLNFASIIIIALTTKPDGTFFRCFSNKNIVALGKYSYAIYLFHMPIRALIRDTVYGPNQFIMLFGSRIPGQVFFYLLAISITFGMAYLSYHFYEKHFLKLKQYVPYDKLNIAPFKS